jgi:hypothetical protein
MMVKAEIWSDAKMAANHPSTVAGKPTRFLRKAIAAGIDEYPRIP